MRKVWICFILILVLTGMFFAAVYFWAIPLGEPNLKVEFDPNPPWQAETGISLELNMNTVNSGWLFAAAKHIHVVVQAPENFVFNSTGTDEFELDLEMLRGGEGRNTPLSLKVPHIIPAGNYSMTTRVSAENAPEQILSAEIVVEQTIYIP